MKSKEENKQKKINPSIISGSIEKKIFDMKNKRKRDSNIGRPTTLTNTKKKN